MIQPITIPISNDIMNKYHMVNMKHWVKTNSKINNHFFLVWLWVSRMKTLKFSLYYFHIFWWFRFFCGPLFLFFLGAFFISPKPPFAPSNCTWVLSRNTVTLSLYCYDTFLIRTWWFRLTIRKFLFFFFTLEINIIRY